MVDEKKKNGESQLDLLDIYNKHKKTCQIKKKEIEEWGTKRQPNLTFLKRRP